MLNGYKAFQQKKRSTIEEDTLNNLLRKYNENTEYPNTDLQRNVLKYFDEYRHHSPGLKFIINNQTLLTLPGKINYLVTLYRSIKCTGNIPKIITWLKLYNLTDYESNSLKELPRGITNWKKDTIIKKIRFIIAQLLEDIGLFDDQEKYKIDTKLYNIPRIRFPVMLSKEHRSLLKTEIENNFTTFAEPVQSAIKTIFENWMDKHNLPKVQ